MHAGQATKNIFSLKSRGRRMSSSSFLAEDLSKSDPSNLEKDFSPEGPTCSQHEKMHTQGLTSEAPGK